MGEQPRADLLGHVKEIGKKAGEGDKNAETESLKLGDVGQEQGIEKSSPGETAIIAEGLRPLPRKLIQKIQNWEFTDLEMLLPNPRAKSEVALSQRQDGVLVVQSLENLKKRKPRILVYPQWVEAFSVYVAVIGKKHPQFIPDLMAYQVLIKEASAHGGARWLNYDREFREKAAAKKLRQWGERDPNLWAKFFSSATPNDRICQHCGSQDHFLEDCVYSSQQTMTSRPVLGMTANQSPASMSTTAKRSMGQKNTRGPCYPFNNTGVCDRRPPCPFPHVCQNCGEGHPARVCPSPRRKVAKRGYGIT